MPDQALRKKIRSRIETTGPISVTDYMTLCLSDYYATREPFGREGDFITAPEVSQMFGELIGAAVIAGFEVAGAPKRLELAELGPGRGTLMSDLLRVAALRQPFVKAACLNMIETSPRLRALQAETLASAPLVPTFRDTFGDIPAGPLFLVANEFFDALPIRQFIKTETGWHERQVGLDASGNLIFGAGAVRLPEEEIPAHIRSAPPGTILETQPAANAIAEEIGARLSEHGGMALLIDYGYLKTGSGDTLQALYKHAFDDVLARPGEADLTAHVNFEALAAAARKGGAIAHPPLTQGDFLLSSGLLERAGSLGAGKSHGEQEALRDAVERLAAPDQMGDLFKVLLLTGNGKPVPPFDSSL